MPAANAPLRVAIDARYWRSTIQTGVERYVLLLLEAVMLRPDLDIAVIIRDSESAAFPRDRFPDTTLLTVADRRARTFDRAVRTFGADVVHYPFDLPHSMEHPAVYTLHDPGRYLFPELMVTGIRNGDNDQLRDQMRNGHLGALVTVSESSRSDILATLGPLSCPLYVVPNFISDDFARLLTRARDRKLLQDQLDQQLNEEARFLLGVGVYSPLKNAPRLIEAYRQARTLSPDIVPDRLLLVGRRGWDRRLPRTYRETERESTAVHATGKAAGDVRVLGHVPDSRLATLYATCTAFIFPTLYEGFGMPVHEALAAGARVLCSDIPVLREIGSELVSYSDPTDIRTLAEAIVARCSTPGPAADQVDRHLVRYTAAAAGQLLEAIYRNVAAKATNNSQVMPPV